MLRHLRLIAFCAGLLASAGCSNEPPTGPTPPSAPSSLPSFSVRAISPSRGSSAGVTIARISGAGFQSGATVTVDGSRVDATVLDPNTITLAMPAHPAGKVDVTVFEPLSEAKASVPGGYTYFVVPEPVISELIPNIGSAAGGAPLIIRGPGLAYAVTVTVDGIVTPFVAEWDDLYLSMPAHQAGTVEVVVTNTDGQMASSVFTYASPGTLDFNGDWQGWAQDLFAPPGSHE